MADAVSSNHLTSLFDLSTDRLVRIVQEGRRYRAERGHHEKPLAGRTLAMVFEKASTRTRVSFEVATYELGGHAINLTSASSQLGRGEPLKDTARVLSGYCDGIMVRTYGQENVEELARYASVPVINGLTDRFHPCQILADVQTVIERFDRKDAADLKDLKVAWIGDGNNVAHSWIAAAGVCGFPLTLACPADRPPAAEVLEQARALEGAGAIEVVTDPAQAARDAAVLNTDVWVSMGDDPQDAQRYRDMFAPYRLDAGLVAKAREDAIVLHCLPAHRGEEITDEVIEGPHSAVWQQAENRLHVQKGILAEFMGSQA